MAGPIWSILICHFLWQRKWQKVPLYGMPHICCCSCGKTSPKSKRSEHLPPSLARISRPRLAVRKAHFRSGTRNKRTCKSPATQADDFGTQKRNTCHCERSEVPTRWLRHNLTKSERQAISNRIQSTISDSPESGIMVLPI
jgi:hypothetical protein